jgi:hypothetical protein
MKAIIVCVEFDDLLRITLPRNAHHFDEIVVVTRPDDVGTIGAVQAAQYIHRRDGPFIYLHKTDAFYRHGCTFNKAAAIEEAFDEVGRDGWFTLLDADIVLPEKWTWPNDSQDWRCLYGPWRRMVRNPNDFTGQPEDEWKQWPVKPDGELAGYCVTFHADCNALKKKPWLDTRWKHAGGYDSFFQQRWPAELRVRMPWSVLHLGDDGANWHGRVTDRVDGQQQCEIVRDARKKLHRDMFAGRKASNGFSGELL